MPSRKSVKADLSSLLRAIREHVWVIVDRKKGEYGGGDEMNVDANVEMHDPGVSIFAVSDVLAVRQAIGAAKKLVGQLPSNYDAKKPLQIALRMAEDALDDSDAVAASHYRAGGFRNAERFACEACALVIRDAGPELLRLAAQIGIDANRDDLRQRMPNEVKRRWRVGHKPTPAEEKQFEAEAAAMLRRNPLISRDELAWHLGVSVGYVSDDCDAWKSRRRHKGRKPRTEKTPPNKRFDLGLVLDNVGYIDNSPDADGSGDELESAEEMSREDALAGLIRQQTKDDNSYKVFKPA